MKQIKTVGNDLIIVEIPESDNREFKEGEGILEHIRNNAVYFSPKNFYLPKGKHEILCKLSELSEEECSRFVELTNTSLYKSYIWDEDKVRDTGIQPLCNTAKESLISLLQSNGIDTSKELLIIEVL